MNVRNCPKLEENDPERRSRSKGDRGVMFFSCIQLCSPDIYSSLCSDLCCGRPVLYGLFAYCFVLSFLKDDDLRKKEHAHFQSFTAAEAVRTPSDHTFLIPLRLIPQIRLHRRENHGQTRTQAEPETVSVHKRNVRITECLVLRFISVYCSSGIMMASSALGSLIGRRVGVRWVGGFLDP